MESEEGSAFDPEDQMPLRTMKALAIVLGPVTDNCPIGG